MTRQQIDRLCPKVPHATNEAARGHLAALLLKGDDRLDDLQLYQCALCEGAWHVGHKHREPQQRRSGRRRVMD